MRHGSLFSGIGGFDLAAEWMGWSNVFHCEWAEFPRKILHHYWPNAISYHDVTQTEFTAHADQIDILTGGFPCQPYSAAGKRKGKDDDRHLWPHMLRAIREIRPRCVVGENVFGLTTWNGGVVLEEVSAELEAEGYAVQPFIIPAAAVGAPHRRDRIWIVAYSVSTGTRHQEHPSCNQDWGTCGNREKSLRQTHGTPSASGANATSANDAFAPYSESLGFGKGQQEAGRERAERQQQGSQVRCSSATTSQEWIATDTDMHGCNECNGNDEVYTGQGRQHAQRDAKQADKQDFWYNFPTQPPVCGGDDGIPTELDGITIPKWRRESIKGYGNAIVPQVAFQIFQAIEQYELTN